jgi:glycosyltransferase involved in cell wall biosynthesis
VKVLMIVEGFGDERYGVEKVVENLAVNALQKRIDIEIITMVIDGPVNDQLKKHVYQVNYWDKTGQVRFHPRQYAEVSELINKIKPGIVHCHGCMSWLQVSAIQASEKAGLPTLISSHGMLEPWLWKQKGFFYYWLKQFYWVLVLKPVLKKTNYVHAITWQEAGTLEREFPGIPQVRISNAIDLSEYSSIQVEPDVDRYMLFIGRLHPKKGVDLLIQAFKTSAVENVRLVIAGPDFDVDYTARLKALVENLGLSERASFVGSVHGEQKSELLQNSWCTVIPSYSDVVALVNLESAASFTPTITTTMTGLSDWQEGGGLLVDPELEPLTNAIVTACNWSQDERMLMGKRARSFVEERYSWDVIGEQWVEAYKMVAKQGKKKYE